MGAITEQRPCGVLWGYYKQVYGAGSDQVSIIWYSCQQMIGTMTFPRAPIVITMKYLPKPQKEQWGLYADVHAGRGAKVILPLSFWFKKNSCAHKAICLFTFSPERLRWHFGVLRFVLRCVVLLPKARRALVCHLSQPTIRLSCSLPTSRLQKPSQATSFLALVDMWELA